MDGSRARALLGVPEHATTQQISRAFRGAAFVAHPDQGGSGDRFRDLVSARDALLACAPRPAVANPYTSTIAAPAEPAFSAIDVRRPAPTPAPAPAPPHAPPYPPTSAPPSETGSSSVSFDDVLASVLAEAA